MEHAHDDDDDDSRGESSGRAVRRCCCSPLSACVAALAAAARSHAKLLRRRASSRMHALARETSLLLVSIRLDARALTLSSVALHRPLALPFVRSPSGAGASGKSTLFKQMINIYGKGFPEASVCTRRNRRGGGSTMQRVRFVAASRLCASSSAPLKYVASFFFECVLV